MRALLITVLIAAALWTGYWFGAARLTEQAAQDWFAAQAGTGVLAGHDGVSVTGFPGQFAVKITRPHLSRDDLGLGWSASDAQVTTRAYSPWRLTLALPEQQLVTLPGQDVTVGSSGMQASLALTPGPTLPLDSSDLRIDGLSLLSSQGWTVGLARFAATTQRAADDPLTHDVTLEATSLTPDEAFRRHLAALSDLPELIDQVRLNAALSFSAPLDRNAGAMQPRLTGLRLRDATFLWGTLAVSAQGDIAPGADDRAEGRIDLRVQNWRAMVPVLVAARLIQPDFAPNIIRALEILAAQGNDPDVLDLPLILSDGWMTLGPIPLGPAPIL